MLYKKILPEYNINQHNFYRRINSIVNKKKIVFDIVNIHTLANIN